MSQTQPKPKSKVLFKVVKGFIYGNVLGLFFGTSIYLLATAVSGLGNITILPGAGVLAGIIYAASVMAGVGAEYSNWLDEQ